MNDSTLRFVLQVVGVLFSAGAIQLFIYIFNRRSALRSLDATSGSTALASANKYIETLQKGEIETRDEGERLRGRIETIETKRGDENRMATLALDSSREEIERLSTALARARSDLIVAQHQIQDLCRQISTGSTGQTT